MIWKSSGSRLSIHTPTARSFQRDLLVAISVLLFDEQRHDLRLNQVSHSYFFLIGMIGWLPRVEGYASAQSGPPEAVMTKEISRIANRYGWTDPSCVMVVPGHPPRLSHPGNTYPKTPAPLVSAPPSGASSIHSVSSS